jgi:hypothetical protein
MAASGPVAIQGVATPTIEGVAFARAALQIEAQRSLGIARRVGRRLVRWLRETDRQEEVLERIVGRDPETGRDIREPVYTAEGKTILVPVLPTDDVRKAWDLYERTVRNLLSEQRARATMNDGKGAVPVDDATFDARLAELAKAAVLEMPRAELEAILRQRAIDVSGPVAAPASPPERQNPPAAGPTADHEPDVLAGFTDDE